MDFTCPANGSNYTELICHFGQWVFELSRKEAFCDKHRPFTNDVRSNFYRDSFSRDAQSSAAIHNLSRSRLCHKSFPWHNEEERKFKQCERHQNLEIKNYS